MRNKNIFITALLVDFILASCAPSTIAVPTEAIIPASTSTSKPTFTLTPIITPTITPTPPPALISANNAKLLIPLITFKGDVQGWDWLPNVVFSPDFKTYTTHFNDHTLILWDVTTGKQINELTGSKSQIWSTEFSPDGKYLASSDEKGKVFLWNVQTGEKIRELSTDYVGTSRVTFTSDSKIIGVASGSDKGILAWFEVETGEHIKTLYCGGYCSVLAFSPIEKIMASNLTLYDHNSIVLRDLTTGKKIQSIPVDGFITALVFSPDGRIIAASKDNGTIALWDVASGQQINVFDHVSRKAGIESGEKGPYSLAFSLDNKILAAGYGGGSLILWDIANTSPITIFHGHNTFYNNSDIVLSLRFSKDGTSLASGQKNNTGAIWGISKSPIPTPSPTQTPSAVILDVKGSYIANSSTLDIYKFSATASSYIIELSSDGNTNLCYLIWQVRPAATDPKSPASWYGDSNLTGSFTITQPGDYEISIGRVHYMRGCNPFAYTLKLSQP